MKIIRDGKLPIVYTGTCKNCGAVIEMGRGISAKTHVQCPTDDCGYLIELKDKKINRIDEASILDNVKSRCIHIESVENELKEVLAEYRITQEAIPLGLIRSHFKELIGDLMLQIDDLKNTY